MMIARRRLVSAISALFSCEEALTLYIAVVEDHSVFQTNGLLDSALEVHESFERNGLLEGDNTGDSVPGILPATTDSRGEQDSRAEETLVESQGRLLFSYCPKLQLKSGSFPYSAAEELPTLSDLLKPYVRSTPVTPSIETGSLGVRAGITATTFDGKPLYLRRRTKAEYKRTVRGFRRNSGYLMHVYTVSTGDRESADIQASRYTDTQTVGPTID